MDAALAVASSESRQAQASEELRSVFFAKSTERARNNRRSAVESLARAVADGSKIHPLSEQL
eukprot:4809256-Amphidinium_carterae.1